MVNELKKYLKYGKFLKLFMTHFVTVITSEKELLHANIKGLDFEQLIREKKP